MLKAKPVPTNDKRTLLMIGLDTIEREFQLPAVPFGDARHWTTTCHLGGFCLQQDSQVERSRFRSWVQRLLIKDAPQVAVLVEKFFKVRIHTRIGKKNTNTRIRSKRLLSAPAFWLLLAPSRPILIPT